MKLSTVAKMHSEDMARHQYFGHISPLFGNLSKRLSQENIPYTLARENISIGPSLSFAHYRLMLSPSHRINLLSTQLTHLGVGIHIDRSEQVPLFYITEIFIR
jgi:uncharacterized protein YkwD